MATTPPTRRQRLTMDVPHDATIQRGKDVDWYRADHPRRPEHAAICASPRRLRRIVPTLHDSTGAVVPLTDGLHPNPASSLPRGRRAGRDVHACSSSSRRSRWCSRTTPAAAWARSWRTSPGRCAASRRTSRRVRRPSRSSPSRSPPCLPDWSDDAYRDRGRRATGSSACVGSSAAETSMLAALQELRVATGTRALLVVTDAETMSYHAWASCGRSCAAMRPTGVHGPRRWWRRAPADHQPDAGLGAQLGRPLRVRDGPRAVSTGRSTGWRPGCAAGDIPHRLRHYVRDRTPGQLSVSPPAGPGRRPVGRRRQRRRCRDRARHLGQHDPQDRQAAAYRHRQVGAHRISSAGRCPRVCRSRCASSTRTTCGSTLLAPLAPLDPASMAAAHQGHHDRQGHPDTPRGDPPAGGRRPGSVRGSQDHRAGDGRPGELQGRPRRRSSRTWSPRASTCASTSSASPSTTRASRRSSSGGRRSATARRSTPRAPAISRRASPPHCGRRSRCTTRSDQLVASGVVGGDPVQLPPGTYRVEVLTDPVREFTKVVIAAGASLDIPLEAPAPQP